MKCKSLILVFFFNCFFYNTNAQILKEHKQVLLNGNIINYTTQLDIPAGLFKVYKDLNKHELVRGNYIDGKRKGNWYFFNYDKTLFLRYNYELGKVVQLNDKSLAIFDVRINADDSEVKIGASIPIPLWSFDSFYILASENAALVLDDATKKYLNNKEVSVKVLINTSGLAKYYLLYRMDNKDYQKEFVIDDRLLDIKWIPASFKSVNYSAEVLFRTKIINTSDTENRTGHKRFNWQ